jgi:hypothetical protein
MNAVQQFIVTLTQALVWPVFLLVFFLVFRSQVAVAIERLQNFTVKIGGAEVTAKMSAMKHTAEAVPSQPSKPRAARASAMVVREQVLAPENLFPEVAAAKAARDQVRAMQIQNLKQRAESSPRNAIEDAWSLLEHSLYQFAASKEIPLPAKPESNPIDVLTSLFQKQSLGSQVFQLIMQMSDFKNMLPYVKERDLTTSHALDYIEAMEKAKETLRID